MKRGLRRTIWLMKQKLVAAISASLKKGTFYAGLKNLEKLAKALNVDNLAAKSEATMG
jgi:hypothetical protein